MSKHVWLTKPTIQKRDELWDSFIYALENGSSPTLARIFAGYVVESGLQKTAVDPKWVWDSAKKTGFRFSKGKNRRNYEVAFNNHLPLFLAPLAGQVGFPPDTLPLSDWYVVRDLLLERDQPDLARYLEAAFSPSETVPYPPRITSSVVRRSD